MPAGPDCGDTWQKEAFRNDSCGTYKGGYVEARVGGDKETGEMVSDQGDGSALRQLNCLLAHAQSQSANPPSSCRTTRRVGQTTDWPSTKSPLGAGRIGMWL